MSVTIGGTTPQLTFADATVQNTAALPLTGGSVSADITVHGLTVGQGGGSVSTNTAVGVNALNATNTGGFNTGVANAALQNNTSGTWNSAFGFGSLNSNLSGSYNTSVGGYALVNNTASNNTAVGYQAGYTNQTGAGNTVMGYQAGYALTTGSYNTFIGVNNLVNGSAGSAITTGSKNTIIGAYTGNQGGLDIRTASNYIVLSDGDGNPRIWSESTYASLQINQASVGLANSNSVSFVTNQGYAVINHTTGTASGTQYWAFGYNSSSIGSITQTGTTAVNFNGNSVPPSDQRLKTNIVDAPTAQSYINSIKVRSFDWIADNTHQTYGMIAQELMVVAPEVVPVHADADTMMGVDYAKLVPALIKYVQELSAQVTTLQTQVTALQAKVGV
jgi:hypothetical protein